jgi:putative membrane protein
MSSEHRLHPYSILFAFVTQIRLFVIPGILVAVGASSRNGDWSDWQPWMMLLIIPNAVFALVRYLTYVYRFDESELVIRSGLVFRRERHIPYSRIQNIDAVQNLLHRLLGVADVKLETGGGETAEATMSVLPFGALDDMRARVFATRLEPQQTRVVAVPPPLLALSTRELLLSGFIDNRGGLIIAAGLGLIWEFGAFDTVAVWLFGGAADSDRPIRTIVRGLWSSATVSLERVAIAFVVLLALFLVVRVASMVWAVVRLHGFTLRLVDDDLRREFGLLTHLTLTVPRRRVQVLTVREGPLHRYFDRVAIRVDTAGGGHGHTGEEQSDSDREYLAPILHKRVLFELVEKVVGVRLADVQWKAAHPRAFRREVKRWLGAAAALSVVLTGIGGWYGIAALPLLVVWAVVVARQSIKHLRWAETADAILLTTGWISRRTIVVRFGKIQVVTRHESPFDRRAAMASVRVDTAGATSGSIVHIPYLDRAAADALRARLAAVAARTELQW